MPTYAEIESTIIDSANDDWVYIASESTYRNKKDIYISILVEERGGVTGEEKPYLNMAENAIIGRHRGSEDGHPFQAIELKIYYKNFCLEVVSASVIKVENKRYFLPDLEERTWKFSDKKLALARAINESRQSDIIVELMQSIS